MRGIRESPTAHGIGVGTLMIAIFACGFALAIAQCEVARVRPALELVGLRSTPDLNDAVGVDDSRLGQHIVLVVSAPPGADIDTDTMLKQLRRRLHRGGPAEAAAPAASGTAAVLP